MYCVFWEKYKQLLSKSRTVFRAMFGWRLLNNVIGCHPEDRFYLGTQQSSCSTEGNYVDLQKTGILYNRTMPSLTGCYHKERDLLFERQKCYPLDLVSLSLLTRFTDFKALGSACVSFLLDKTRWQSSSLPLSQRFSWERFTWRQTACTYPPQMDFLCFLCCCYS